MRKITGIILLSVAILATRASAQSQRSVQTDNKLGTDVDSVVQKAAMAYMQDSRANGLSIGLYLDGKTYTYDYGEIRRGSGILPTPDTFYGIGSIDKTFINMILARAVVEKRVGLNDDIRKYLPDSYPNLSYGGQPIRFLNLANHTSGLPNVFTLRKYPPQITDSLRKLPLAGQAAFYARYNEDSLLADLHNVRIEFAPGSKFRYDDNDVKVMALLLERIYHRPFGELLENYLETRLGMHDTKTELSPAEMKRASTGYFKDGEPQPFINFKGFIAGPFIASTVNDMLKYIRANLSERDKAIWLSHQSTWGKKGAFGLGMGWMIDYDGKGEKYIYHDGSTRLGFNSLCVFYPGRQYGVIIFVNDHIGLDKVGQIENTIRSGLNK